EFAGASATGNLVHGNYIGADVSGMLNLGNSSSGVNLIGGNNTIGGVAAGEGNLIAFNLAEGVHVEMGAIGSIRGNSIHSNAQLGINLVTAGDPASGVTPNDNCDSDFGPNQLQNFPLVTSVTTSGGNVVINGTL